MNKFIPAIATAGALVTTASALTPSINHTVYDNFLFNGTNSKVVDGEAHTTTVSFDEEKYGFGIWNLLSGNDPMETDFYSWFSLGSTSGVDFSGGLALWKYHPSGGDFQGDLHASTTVAGIDLGVDLSVLLESGATNSKLTASKAWQKQFPNGSFLDSISTGLTAGIGHSTGSYFGANGTDSFYGTAKVGMTKGQWSAGAEFTQHKGLAGNPSNNSASVYVSQSFGK